MEGVVRLRRGWNSSSVSCWDMEHLQIRSTLMRGTVTKEAEKKRRESQEYPISLMMKLGWGQKKTENVYALLASYEEVVREHRETWFGTNALASGVGRRRRQELLGAIANNKAVHIYFIVGKMAGGRNEIEYRAEVTDLESKKGGMTCPDITLVPANHRHDKCSIWIKLKNLEPYTEKTVGDFKFVSNDKLLKQALNGTGSFGYITGLNSIF